MPFVVLTPDEWKMAIGVAADRQLSAIKKGLKDSVKKKKHWVEDLTFHAYGVIGEMAAAKVLGLTFTGSVDTFRNHPDLSGMEVRFRSNPTWQLIVRDNDKDDAKYLLVRGVPPSAVEVVGWIMGRDAKNPEWLRSYGNLKPAHFVPDSELIPLDRSHAT